MCWRGDTRDGALSLRTCREAISTHFSQTADGEEYVETADQIIGELLGNVCRHAPGPFCVELHRDDRTLEISVHDSGHCFDTSGVPPVDEIQWEDERGRGLAIVAALGGKIEAHEEPRGGCRVAVVLELEELTETPAVPSHCPHDHPATRDEHCPRIAQFVRSQKFGASPANRQT